MVLLDASRSRPIDREQRLQPEDVELAETLAVMREAKCGVPDVENFSLYPRRAKWRNHTITYRDPSAVMYRNYKYYDSLQHKLSSDDLWNSLWYDERKRKMESGFPRLIRKDGLASGDECAFELHGKNPKRNPCRS
ncbi:unnamed protein product [Merluccius merluccius]